MATDAGFAVSIPVALTFLKRAMKTLCDSLSVLNHVSSDYAFGPHHSMIPQPLALCGFPVWMDEDGDIILRKRIVPPYGISQFLC